jgi:lactate permease
MAVALLTFRQILAPVGDNALASTLLALVPVVVLLFMLAVLRITAWLAALIGSAVTFVLAVWLWQAPLADTGKAYVYGTITGIQNVDWITFWGVVIFNTLVVTGAFTRFRQWLVAQATEDVRVQAILLAWAFGALLEGLVGFGYPWSVVAPILIALGVVEIEALRVAALANNAPVSFGALGAPIIALATVTQLPIRELSSSIGNVVAILAILPPFVLIYLVSGWRGVRTGWPLAVVGIIGYVAGQWPTSHFLGPYLPDVIGALVCFLLLLGFLRIWRPAEILSYGGRPVIAGGSTPPDHGEAVADREAGRALTAGQVFMAVLPFIILVVVVVAWTGPWYAKGKAPTDVNPFTLSVKAISSLGKHKAGATSYKALPFVAGTAILVSWLLILAVLRPTAVQIGEVFRRTFTQMWGALLVGAFIFGLAFVFNFAGMANSLANGLAKVGTFYIVLAPIVGFIGVALSGSNTSTNTFFGAFQATVGKLLGFPVLLTPTLNSVGAEIGKPVAIQTASVGVSTTSYVRREGFVIRHNFGWTMIFLLYLIGIGCLYYFVLPGVMRG